MTASPIHSRRPARFTSYLTIAGGAAFLPRWSGLGVVAALPERRRRDDHMDEAAVRDGRDRGWTRLAPGRTRVVPRRIPREAVPLLQTSAVAGCAVSRPGREVARIRGDRSHRAAGRARGPGA